MDTNTKVSIRDAFVQRFSEADALAMERAAAEHENGIHDKQGSDPFKWACVICVGYECFTRERFHQYHGFTASGADIKAWLIEHGEFASHDGEMDYISLLAGAYNEYVGAKGGAQ